MIDKNQLYNNLNEGILEERLSAFERNLQKNLGLIKKFGGLKRILPCFDGKNVIVIGAGPSLEKNLDLLREHQFRADIVLIATDMALRPLVKSGIKPHYLFSCETNPVDFFIGIETSDIHLIAFSCMSNINLRKWNGNISFYNWMMNRPEYNRLWEKAGIDLGFVATGNIITTQAVSFALGCSIRSLMLAGNDLGFYDRYYAKESVVYMNYLISNNRCATLDTYEINLSRKGREYEVNRGMRIFFTSNQFLAAKMWLEELFSSGKFPVYDCSNPGCSEKYIVKIELKEFFSLFARRKKRKRR